jgi:oxygen-dependent protoporphyrinogen oxidase
MSRPLSVTVVGGGIAGLATALAIRDRAAANGQPLTLSVLEAAPRLGGNILSERSDGYTVEWGPNGFLDNVPATLELVRRVGLEAELQRADDAAAKRFLWRHGRLHQLPLGPASFFASPVLSLGGRLRILREPWTPAKPAGLDETVHAFASRHLGVEAADYLVAPMVSGVFAGDARALSLHSAFPKMAAMEAAHGSLVRAMLAKGRERKAAKREAAERAARGEPVAELTRPGGPAGPGGTLTSFRGGLDTWIAALARELGPAVETSRPLTALARHGDSWELVLAEGERRSADRVVLAVPANAARRLVAPLDPELAATLDAIPSAGLAVVGLAFDAAAIGGAPNGFGFLAPRGEGLRILGCLWDSSIFPGRAPQGKVLLRAMIGGALDPEAVGLDDPTLLSVVRADLGRAMGLTAVPERHWIFRHPLGIGQYTVGHAERLERIAQRLATLPGLAVAGQSYFGVSMNACVEKAGELAAQALQGR